MTGILTPWRAVLRTLAVVERLALVLLIANIVINITAQVISRYLFGLPLVWVEEVATYSFIWATFVGAALGLKYDRHVKIETFVSRLPPRGAAVLRLVVAVLILALLLWMLPKAWTNMVLEMKRMTIALPHPIPIGWFFSVPLMVGAASMALTVGYRIANELHVISGGPPLALMDEDPPDDDEDLQAERALTGDRS